MARKWGAGRLQRMAARYRASVQVVAVRAHDAAAAHSLGGDGHAVLVRPDDHVAMVARMHDANALAQHLDRWLLRA